MYPEGAKLYIKYLSTGYGVAWLRSQLLSRQRQENGEFQASPESSVKPYLKNKKHKQKEWGRQSIYPAGQRPWIQSPEP
jgi:hypothetical protein